MSAYLMAQAVNAAIVILFGCFLVWRYHLRVGRTARLRSYQYRMFAIRDEVIRLVAEQKITESDNRWRKLYTLANEAARATNVAKFTNGSRFVLSILRNSTPPDNEDIEDILRVPDALRDVFAKLVASIVVICVDASRVLKMVLWMSRRFSRVKSWLERRNPSEIQKYRGWVLASQASSNRMCPAG
jgi:hypothetical protein